jgi:hypothetical protein
VNRAVVPPTYGPYLRPAERAKTPVIESPTYLTYIGIGRSGWLAQSVERPLAALTSHHGVGPTGSIPRADRLTPPYILSR